MNPRASACPARAVRRRTRLCAVLVGPVLVAACRRDAPAPSAPPAAKVQAPVPEATLTTVTLTPEAATRLGIRTVVVERKALRRTRTVGGEVVAPAGATSVVAAPFAGTLETPGEVPAVGTTIASGTAVFHLIPLAPAERDATIDAQRAVDEARARQTLAARRLTRAEQLVKDGAGSRRAVEEAQSEIGIADADLKAASARLALADRGSAGGAGITLDAPYAALLRNIHASAGQRVAAGAPLFELVRLDSVWVRVPIYVGESNTIDARAPARVVGLGDPADAEGVLARPIAAPPSADPATAAVDLYFALSNQQGAFRPGQRVGVRLTRTGEAPSVVVPRASLLYDAYGGAWVYEARDGQVYVRRRVAVADLVDEYAVLSQGPSVGTPVVTDGAAELFGMEFGAGK